MSSERLSEYDALIETLIDNVRIYEGEDIVFNTIDAELPQNFFKKNEAVIVDNFRYLMKDVQISEKNFSILARIPTL